MKLRILVVMLLFSALKVFAQNQEDDRLKNSYTVVKEILTAPDQGFPRICSTSPNV